MIIQVGDKDDFSSKQDFEKANEILEEWLLGFEKRNPNLKFITQSFIMMKRAHTCI